MAFDGNGVFSYTPTTVTPAVTGTTIDSSDFNTFTAELTTALNLCVVNNQTEAPTLLNPKILTTIKDTNGNELVDFGTTASAVNNVRITNAATGDAAKIDVTETDTDLELAGNGAGGAYGTITTHDSSPFATTSGASVSVTGIPSWAKRITVSLYEVSTNGTADPIYIQIGDSSGLHSSGYLSEASSIVGVNTCSVGGSGAVFLINTAAQQTVASVYSGICTIILEDASNFNYISSATIAESTNSEVITSAGSVTLDTVMTQLSLITTGGTFDAGSFSVHYEG